MIILHQHRPSTTFQGANQDHEQNSRADVAPPSEQARWLRQTLHENQTEFWARFGVTQSQGSRFEQGCWMPPPVAILLALYLNMRIGNSDLEDALEMASSTGHDHARSN